MTKLQYIQFLRDQAEYLNELANQVEADEQHLCDWKIELPLPEFECEKGVA